MKPFCLFTIPMMFLVCGAATGMDDEALRKVVEQRVKGNPSGACVAVAYVGKASARAFVCADDEAPRRLDGTSRFEIGSLTKAMLGALTARLAELELLDIDEPIAALLPPTAEVPAFNEQPIVVRDLLTHTSGLPRLPIALMADMDMSNPYRDLTEDNILDVLSQIKLERAPGGAFEYSNFGAMLLSVALVHRTGQDLDALFEEHLFAPLDMAGASLGGNTIQGHDAYGKPASPWDFPVNLAGVGGVRASLDDMVKWLAANLGRGESEAASALTLAHQELVSPSGQSVAWGWLRVPRENGVMIVHDGGTGGFSSFMALDPDKGVGAVVLSDTSVVLQGSFGDLAMHLVDDSIPLSVPDATE